MHLVIFQRLIVRDVRKQVFVKGWKKCPKIDFNVKNVVVINRVEYLIKMKTKKKC